MRIDDTTSNLFYWNGQESDGIPGLNPADVRFGAAPTSAYRLNFLNLSYFADGTNAPAPGGVIDTTASDGSMHRHRFFFLDDGDANSATIPADGVYLISMRLRMSGLKTSLPIYIAFGVFNSPNSDFHALDSAAVPWITGNQNSLVLSGDYNKNGVVDAADYTVWRNSLGQTGFGLSSDGDASGRVDLGDFYQWRDNYGKKSPLNGVISGAQVGLAAVPEPNTQVAAISALLFGLAQLRRRVVTQF